MNFDGRLSYEGPREGRLTAGYRQTHISIRLLFHC
jgi:hypothetical protein